VLITPYGRLDSVKHINDGFLVCVLYSVKIIAKSRETKYEYLSVTNVML
jgi:hypothetical protein